MMTCPQCGKKTAEGAFCERCGADLPVAPAAPQPEEPKTMAPPPIEPPPIEPKTISIVRPVFRVEPSFDDRIRAVEERIEREVSDENLLSKQRGEPKLEYDRECVLFENTSGAMWFRFNPQGGGDRVENVVFELENGASGQKVGHRIRRADRRMEFAIQLPPQAVGLQIWEVRVEYQSSRRKHALVGQFQIVVRPVESRKRGADNISININTNIGSVGNASDVTVHQGGSEGLQRLAEQANPFEEMEHRALSGQRQWSDIQFSDDSLVVDLPTMPAQAVTDRITLDFGARRIHFFSDRCVKFGRTREQNDISLRPRDGDDESAAIPYRMVSRLHCRFEHLGDKVVITDVSSGGTYWNNEKIAFSKELSVGSSGVCSFGRAECAGGLAMELRVCSPAKACETCPHSNIHWCGEGHRPSLMLTRRDGIEIDERFVALWSCFWLGEADPSFDGVVIFRKDGAFAFRDGSRSGWLVPGESVKSDFGFINIR